ncbi:uncharacterized protein [Acropora muricata]|uniref:uncharacterized protein n=1 Tax=Acropora muricata TaxID=159855 RepID=UPI0034E50AE7
MRENDDSAEYGTGANRPKRVRKPTAKCHWVQELPAKSCAEIKASEGKAMTSGIHWIYSDENLDQAIETTCEEYQDALGMENGGVLDEQITASSELNDNSAAYEGRLNVNESVQGSTIKSGAWVASGYKLICSTTNH